LLQFRTTCSHFYKSSRGEYPIIEPADPSIYPTISMKNRVHDCLEDQGVQ
jgi:hypothetical protein